MSFKSRAKRAVRNTMKARPAVLTRNETNGIRSSLAQKMEVISEQTDTADPNLLPYLNEFISRLQDMKPLEEISLLTQEDAAQALATIDRTLEELNNHLGVAKSLKHLLQNTKR